MRFLNLTSKPTMFLACALLFATTAFAQESVHSFITGDRFESELRFGAEWTLTSDALFKSFPDGTTPVTSTPYSKELVRAFQAALETKYAGQARPPIFENTAFHSHWERDAFSIEYPNQFKMTVFSDPGVLEVNSSPSSVRSLEANRNRIQSDIFDQGKKLGVEPGLFAGSGHMHIETTRLHPDTLRNFLADFYNHTGLAAGAFNEDVYNALGAGEMSPRSKRRLQQAFRLHDKRRSYRRTSEALIANLEEAHDIPLEEDLREYQESGRGKRADKYFAISFKSFFTLGTIEIRALRPQSNADSYLKLARLFAARMKHAEDQRLKGILVPIGEFKSVRGNPQAVLAHFDHYLEEVGFKLEDYAEFVLPWWQGSESEVGSYLAAKAAAKPNICSDAFASKASPNASSPSPKTPKSSLSRFFDLFRLN